MWAAATALAAVSCCVQAGVLLLLPLLLPAAQSPLVIRDMPFAVTDVQLSTSPTDFIFRRSTVDALGPFLDDVTYNDD